MIGAKVTLFIQKRGATSKDDDIIRIYETPDFTEMFRVVYKPGEFKERQNQFYMPRHVLQHYISDLMKSLNADADPFEYIQVTTAQHPSVLYHISDLDNRGTRYMIEDMIMEAVRIPIEAVKISRRE